MFRPLITIIIATCLLLPLSISAWANDEANEVLRVYHVPRAEINQLRYYGDVWGLNWREDYVHIHVTPRGRRALEELGYTVETDREATERLEWFRNIDREAWALSGVGGIPGFSCYRTVDETYNTFSDLDIQYPDFVEVTTIGQSWQAINNPPTEGDIKALVLSNENSPYDKAPLVIMAAQHARELTTAETATRFAEVLLHERETDGDIAWLLDHREIHIIAQQNPDGRRQVEQGADFWRKNHNTTACPGGTVGIDLNRNSSFLWGDDVWSGGSSGFPCNEIYRGTAEASEPETQTLEDYLADVFEDQRPPGMDAPAPDDAKGIFISIHSYGEWVLFPWEALGGGAANHSPNHNQLAYLGRKFGYYTGYEVGRDILYPANGTMVDYAYGEFGVAAYTYELGSAAQGQFQTSCSAFEDTIWPDVREALLYAAKAAERPYQAPSGPDVTGLDAVFNAITGQVDVTAVADGTRYDRGGVSEGPADDPVFDITGAVASFDLPPHLAETSFPLALDDSGTVVGLNGEIPVGGSSGEPRLLFVTATDAGNHTGVPTAIWVDIPLVPLPGQLAVEPSAWDFGEVQVNETATLDFTVSNAADAGAEALTLDIIALTGDGFAIAGGDCAQGNALDPGDSCAIGVTFSPDAAGEFSGELSIEAGDGNEGQQATVMLAGTGVQDPGELLVDPAALDFGNVAVDGSGVLAVAVSNVAAEGAADLAITQIEVIAGEDAFAIDMDGSDCGAALAAQMSCTAAVQFLPPEVGVYAGVLRIVADGETVNVNLSGNGIEPVPNIFEDRFEEM